MRESAWIGLGANLGDPRAQIEGALAALGEDPRLTVERISELIASAPVGGPPGQPQYLNGVAEIRFRGTPHGLLELLMTVERQFGRRRLVANGPRTIDLDLLAMGDRIVRDAVLTLPHPRLARRAFVLGPWASLAPQTRLPGFQRTVGELLEALESAGVGVLP